MVVKINDTFLYYTSMEVQQRMNFQPYTAINEGYNNPSTISISFDISKYPQYKQFLINLPENNQYNIGKANKSEIITYNFECHGCVAKSYSMCDKTIEMSFICDYTIAFSKEQIRERKINQLLDHGNK